MTTSTSGLSDGEGLLGRVDLALADPVHVVEDLALQVGGVDHVHVDDADGADTGRSQVQRGGRAEAAGAEQQHLGVEQLELALLPHLGEQQMALVAVALLGVEGPRRRPGTSVVLPAVEATDERRPRRCSRVRPWSWPRKPTARRRRSTRRPGRDLSGMRPSTENSSWPRGRCTAPGMAPCSYSSGSRTSRNTTRSSSSSGCTSSACASRIAALASFNNSLAVATDITTFRLASVGAARRLRCCRCKPYQGGQHSPRAREPASGV